MAIDTDKQILDQITSLVYQWLFGMSRDEMLVEYKNHKLIAPRWVKNPQPMHADEDENMRDHLTIAALNSLTSAEMALASYITRYGICWSVSCIAEFYMIIEPYKVDGLIIWNDEANGS